MYDIEPSIKRTYLLSGSCVRIEARYTVKTQA